MIIAIVILCLAVIALVYLLSTALRKSLTDETKPPPFRIEWRPILDQRVPIYRKLPGKEREALEEHIARFLATKSFEACGGLAAVDDDIQLAIAGNACLLYAGRPEETDLFPTLRSILVYPDAYERGNEERYEVEGEGWSGGGDIAPSSGALLGESWGSGSVIVSWKSIREDADAGLDGFNLVLHEFSHQLDQDFGDADGLPLLDKSEDYAEWAKAFERGFEKHRKRTRSGRKTAVDDYGATEPAEFFACTTEAFFEIPKELHSELPGVYEQLCKYYRVDPRTW